MAAIPARTSVAKVRLAVTRDAGGAVTIEQKNGVASTTGWNVGPLNVRAVASGSDWKLQVETGVDVATASTIATVECGVRELTSQAWSGDDEILFFEPDAVATDPTEAQVRAALAAATATIDINAQTVSDCAGVTRTSGNLDISTVTAGDIILTSAGEASMTAATTGGIVAGGTAVVSGADAQLTATSGDVVVSASGEISAYAPAVNIGLGATVERTRFDDNGAKSRQRMYDSGNAVGLTIEAASSGGAGASTIAAASGLTVSAAGPLNVTGNGSGTTVTDAGTLSVDGQSSLILQGRAGFTLSIGTNRYIQYYYFAAGTPLRRDWMFAPVTPGSGAATSLGTHSVPASSSGRFIGTLSVRDGSANDKEFDVSFDWNADGTTIAHRNLSVVATTVQGTIGTVAGDVALGTPSGLTHTVTVANASGLRCILSGVARINA